MQNVITGAGITLKINNTVVGWATQIGYSRSQNVKTIYELDNPIPVEHSPTVYDVSGSVSGIKIRDVTLDNQGVLNLQSANDIFRQRYITIEVIDRSTGKTMFTVVDCMVVGDSWSVGAKGTASLNFNFKGKFIQIFG